MIVVAIIGVFGALAAGSMSRSADRANLNSAGSLLKSRLEMSRALAVALAGRFGTAAMAVDASCDTGGNGLFMTFDLAAGTYNVPTQVVEDAAGVSVVSCNTFNLDDDSHHRAQGAPTSVTPVVTFTPSGRLVDIAGQPAELFALLQNPNDANEQYGVRVLSSGVLCRSFDPAQGACDAEDGL